jgi:hypothetical protein
MLPGSRTSWNQSAEKDGTGVGETEAGPGPPIGEGKDQLESGRDGGDVMREDQLPKE